MPKKKTHAQAGRKGGKVRSAAKTKANRANALARWAKYRAEKESK